LSALSGETIGRLCQTEQLIQPFNSQMLRGAKYDLRVGAKAVRAVPGGHDTCCLDVAGKITLAPYSKAIIYTYEDVRMPADLRGELSIRSEFHKRGVVSVTGPVDPGYHGKLFIHLINTGDAPVEIDYMYPIASIGFFELDQPTQMLYAGGDYQADIDPEDLKPYPENRVEDLTRLAATVEELRSTAHELQVSARSAEALLNNFYLAAVAGVIAGIAFALVHSVYSSEGLFAAALAFALGVSGVALYHFYRRSKLHE